MLVAFANRPVKSPNLELADLIGPLSYALDLTEGQPKDHCIRCCYIGMALGRALGLPEAELADLFYTLLLKDLGCSSNAARICELFLADDIDFKQGFKTIDPGFNAALSFVFKRTGLKAGLSERIRALVKICREGERTTQDMISTRCHRGADIAAKLRFSSAVQEGIRSLDEHWNGKGQPFGLTGNDIPRASSIALLAQVVDVFHSEGGPGGVATELHKRRGSWFDPQLVDAFDALNASEGFWEMLASPDMPDWLLDTAPSIAGLPVDEEYLDDVAQAFSDVVDAKSPFTADHSNRVTLYADMISEELGLADNHRRWIRRAALLHDIGKLAVSNQVLDKPGKLDENEWKAVRLHPLISENILKRVPAFADMAQVAGAHHERLDGKGYPHGLAGDDIPLEARILTVADVFDALSAERPYRAAMPIEKALAILDEDTGTAFDGECVTALKRGLERLSQVIEQPKIASNQTIAA
ncbi:HD-GYP domain-containing protein [Ahrensia sp. R2A130]|uniref:HD-GYP domain-containing protein n=1 Tax=Ahrensia sp. R2A130 TaxID=744979 RepID=UPI0001E083FF|nr:HD-GYP domain-containing protein [Ahrensia sp. R2A130]EFL88498.1 metal-dependent phosphohydrolase [Ahrensia sp. R2A130]